MRLLSVPAGCLVVLLGVQAGLLAGCSAGEAPDATVDDLAAALSARDLSGVAIDTGDAGDAGEQYAAALALLPEDTAPSVEVEEVTTQDEAASAQLHWTWDLEGHTWDYTSTAGLERVEDAWQVEWEPGVVHPGLRPGEQLDVDTVSAPRSDILGAGDRPLVTLRPVVRLGLDKTQVGAGRVADSARRIARALGIDVEPYVERAEATGDAAFVEALVLRTEDARQDVPPSYGDIPGAVALDDEIPLAPTRTFAAPLLGTVGEATAELIEESGGELEPGDVVGLSGLQARYDDRLRGTPGLTVSAVPAQESEARGEPRVLHEVAPVPGEPLRTTLDQEVQLRAEAALAEAAPAAPSDEIPPSALVAIRPSDGAILAAASGPGSGGLNTATYGRYAPGSTFKVVSSLALLRTGLRPESTVSCPPEETVDGKSFGNYSDYPPSQLGTITLRQAVAHSCNTAFISQRHRLLGGRLGRSDLARAAAALGLGVDHDLGFPAYFGQVPPPESEVELAADLIGQGQVLASPMTMAAVAASVVRGEAVLPTLLPDHEVEQVEPDQPLTRAEAEALRGLMRAVVTEGSGSFLAGLGVDGAKTGTAEYGSVRRDGDLPTHTWMLATRGDLAVAAFVETGESGSQTAGPILQAFLS